MLRHPSLTALLISIVHATLLAWWLTRPTSSFQTHRLDNWEFDRPGTLHAFIAVPFLSSTGPDGRTVHRLELKEFWRTNLSAAERVAFRIEVSDSKTPPDSLRRSGVAVTEVGLESSTGGHRFASGVRSLSSGELIECQRVANGRDAASGTNVYELHLTTAEPVTLRLRCNGGSATKPDDFRPELWPGLLAVDLPSQVGDQPGQRRWGFAQGSYSTRSTAPPLLRVELLRRWWGFASPACWWWGCGLSSLLLGMAAWLWLGSRHRSAKMMAAGQEVGAVMALAAALSGDFALVTPPLQGPDEPSHLVSILSWRGTTNLVDEFLQFGLRSHAVRLTNRPEQKFSAADLDKPLDWFVFSVRDMDSNVPQRSAVAARVWGLAWLGFDGFSVPARLMALRLCSVAVWCALAGVAAMVAGTRPGRTLTVALLLVAPSVTWFGMTVSNWAFTSGIVVVLVGALVRVAGGNRDGLAGIAIGFAMGFALQNSLTLMTWVSGVVVILGGIALCGRQPQSNDSNAMPGAWRFWAAALFAFGSSYWIGTSEHDEYIRGWVMKVAGPRVERVPWFLVWWGGAFTGVLAGYTAECLVNKLRCSQAKLVTVANGTGHHLKTALLWLPLAGLLTWQLIVFVTPAPQLPPMKEPLPSWEFQARLQLPSLPVDNWEDTGWRLQGWPYLARSIKATLGSFGVGDHDYLTSVLFWSYLGYNDVWLPDWAISLVNLIFVLGLGFWLAPRLGNSPPSQRWFEFFWLIGSLVCLAMTAGASAFGSYAPSIHGRYLIPFYVMVLGLGAWGWTRLLEALKSGFRRAWLGLLMVTLVFHHYALAFIAHRYF